MPIGYVATFAHVSKFVDSEIMVEIEADAIVDHFS